MRATIEDTACPGAGDPVRVTVSVGLAELKPGDFLSSLLNQADEALCRAKQNRRNQVRVG